MNNLLIDTIKSNVMEASSNVTGIDQLQGYVDRCQWTFVERVEKLLEDFVIVLGRVVKFRDSAAVCESRVGGKTAEQFHGIAQTLPANFVFEEPSVARFEAHGHGERVEYETNDGDNIVSRH